MLVPFISLKNVKYYEKCSSYSKGLGLCNTCTVQEINPFIHHPHSFLRLEEAEVNAVRGGRKAIEKLEAKVMHLNAELDMENKFKVDLNKKHNKAERKFREMEFQWEEERKSSNRLQVKIVQL